MFKSKIHRVTVTHANPDYEGSVSIDRDLMDLADVIENEAVEVWNITRGTRLTTYALSAPGGSGIICLNGAAARLNEPGDLVILATFTELEDVEARQHVPRVVRVDSKNRPLVDSQPEKPGPALPATIAQAPLPRI
jgi:aspartate 1-decarboxylase